MCRSGDVRIAQNKAPPAGEARNRGVSVAVLVCGLTLTAVVAVLQQSNARHERNLKFEAAAAHVQEDLVDAVDTTVKDFQSGINFIAATHPGPLDQYQAFFTREVEAVLNNDPGVLFLEFVATDEIDGLLDRERALGNDDLSLTVLPGPADERLIVTRLARPAQIFGLPLLGLDVTALQRQLLPDDLSSNGFELFIVASEDLAGFISPEGLEDENHADYEDYVAFLMGAVTTNDDTFIGYAIYFQTVRGLLESVTEQDLDRLSIELYVVGIDEPVASRLSPDAPAADAAGLKAVREITTTSQEWRIEVRADPDFGPPTGLFDQFWVWIVGSLATATAYGATIRRLRNRWHLDTARFELAHARTLALTDPLTGLLNRNGLVEAARRAPNDGPATVFFIDLDGFKLVNDTAGHERGDQVLRAVAAQLRTIFRAEDLVSRLGGDEFVVFTRQRGTSQDVRAISARITGAISTIDERVTCSLGVSSRNRGQATDVKDLIRAADAAMYEAKRSGGDQFAVGPSIG